MNSAPEKREIVHSAATATVRGPVLPNPALDEVMSAYERQSRLLDAAFSSVRGLGDVQVAVRPELLEAIDDVCAIRVDSSISLRSFNRC